MMAGSGGKPVRSRASLRASTRRSASGAGASPSCSSRERMKRSSGCFTQPSCFTAGGVGRVGGMNDQCGWYSAPSAIQRLSSSFCSGRSTFLSAGGGMTSSGSSEKMRSSMTLESGSPGAIAPDSTASSRRSRRRSPFRLALSAPWQEKQFSTRIGRMSLLKSSPEARPAGPATRTESRQTYSNRNSRMRSPRCGHAATQKSRSIQQEKPRNRRCTPPSASIEDSST